MIGEEYEDDTCPPTQRLAGAIVVETPTRSAELVVAERFHAYRQLAAGTAYQLEAPLARVSASIRSVLEGLVPNDARSDAALLDALRAAERATAIVRGLMSFAGAGHVRPEPTDVHEAIEIALRIARTDIDHRARLVRRYGDVPAVRASIPKLAQIVLNVLTNAAEAIPRFAPVANAILVATRVEDGEVVIEISDTGIGIEEEHLERVFDPFFTTRADEEATGLGLTAARSLVLELGGRLELESVFGRGTTCRVVLPALATAAPRARPASGVELPARRVLAVAPDVTAGRVLAERLEDERTVVRIASEEDALDSVALGEPWDLVVLARDDEAFVDRVRERLAALAPDLVMRTFTLPAGPARDHASGVYLRTREVERVAG